MSNNDYVLKYDLIFKSVFNNKKYLKRLLEETLELKVNDLILLNTEMEV